jgi:polyvinyl alcohol dehydrogenase (cytochrome)
MRLIAALTAALLFAPPLAQAAEPDADGLYRVRCAVCHDKPAERMPGRDTLKALPADAIEKALTTGVMKSQAEGLAAAEIRALAAYLGAASVVAAAPTASCTAAAGRFGIREHDWNGWSRDLHSARFQPQPGLSAEQVPRLRVKWVHRYAGRSAYGQPSIVGGRVFVTASTGRVSALDAKTGCELWGYDAGSGVKSAVMVADLGSDAPVRFAAIFGDESAHAHAIDADTGKPLWKTRLDTHALARVTGHAKVHDGRVYMPVSSIEIAVAGRNPSYPCCTFQGSLVALDAKTGQVIWKTASLTKPPAPFRNTAGTQMHGPAGAAIWSAPTLDLQRKLVYVATGNSYTDVEDAGSNAVQALDMATGERKWVNQATPRDNYLVGCTRGTAGVGNCPEQLGPDHDFGSAPLLQTLPDGRQILIASQKSGMVYGLVPDTGKTVWQRRVGAGSALGGVEHDPAADGERVYVPVSDLIARPDPKPGLNALNPATGEVLWHVPTPEAKCAWGTVRCARAQSAAVTAMPGVVFAGSFDGHIRAYESASGKLLWSYDTAVRHTAVDGTPTSGGSIDFGGTTIADGIVYVNSGYGLWGHIGHALIAFSVDGR